MHRIIDTLVFSGGGSKGIAYCGVLKALHEAQQRGQVTIDIQRICSVSVGALFGMAIAIGYSYTELMDELMTKDFEYLKDIRLSTFLEQYGFDTGERMIGWMETLMYKKGFVKDTTFLELHARTAIWFQVYATCIHTNSLQTFDYTMTPHVPITAALRMSMSIPLLYAPMNWEGHLFVDGGVVDNYPIKMVGENLDSTLGCMLVSHVPVSGKRTIGNLQEYMTAVMSSLMAQNELYNKEKYSTCTVSIHVDDFGIMDMNMDTQKRQELVERGYTAAKRFIAQRYKIKVD